MEIERERHFHIHAFEDFENLLIETSGNELQKNHLLYYSILSYYDKIVWHQKMYESTTITTLSIKVFLVQKTGFTHEIIFPNHVCVTQVYS